MIGTGGVTFKRTLMSGFAEFLSGLSSVSRPVLDKTGMTGVFDFALTSSDGQPGAQLDKRAIFTWPSIFTDVQELGLKLESTKAPVEFLVIDHAENPSVNERWLMPRP